MNWIEIEKERPRCCDDILFSDGQKIYMGWLETCEPEEDLSFYSIARHSRWSDSSPENITHWMPLPKLPT